MEIAEIIQALIIIDILGGMNKIMITMKYEKNVKTRIEAALPKSGLVSIKEIAKKTGISLYTVWWNINHLKNVVKVRIGKIKHEYYIKKLDKEVFQHIQKRMKYCAEYMWIKFKNNIATVHQYIQETSLQLLSLVKDRELAT